MNITKLLVNRSTDIFFPTLCMLVMFVNKLTDVFIDAKVPEELNTFVDNLLLFLSTGLNKSFQSQVFLLVRIVILFFVLSFIVAKDEVF